MAKRVEVTNELLFETLKTMQGSIARLSDGMREVMERRGTLEVQYANLSVRVGRIDARLERVERRLDLVAG